MKYQDKKAEQKQQLKAIISNHGVWEEHPNKERQTEAKIALAQFLSTLKSMQVDCVQQDERISSLHITHIHYLVWVDRELDSQNYVDACCELETLVQYLPIFEPHIYWNIIALLEQYIKVGSPDVTVKNKEPQSAVTTPNEKKIVIITLSLECDKQKELIQMVERISMMIAPNIILGEEAGHTELAGYTELDDIIWGEYCNKLQQHSNLLLKHSKELKNIEPWVVWMN